MPLLNKSVLRSILSFCAFSTVFGAADCRATEITVSDCLGVTRAQSVLRDQAVLSNLEIVADSSQGGAPKTFILSSENGEKRSVTLDKNGAGFVSNISGGNYQLCDEGRVGKILEAKLMPASESNESAISLTSVGVSAAALGGTMLALGSTNNGDSPVGDSAGSNSLVGQTELQNVPPVTNGASSKPATQTSSNQNCLNGARVNPISPFE